MKLALILAAIFVGAEVDSETASKESPEKPAQVKVSTDTTTKPKPAFEFAGTDYFLRYTHEDQREYTPEGQEDLEKWTDMVTVQHYRKATDGDRLTKVANSVADNYRAAKGRIIRTISVPRTKDAAAEHYVSVLFRRPEFAETAFARFKLQDGFGAAVIYSHRSHGKNAGHEMSEWLAKNGDATEKTILKWDAWPKPREVNDAK
jgi:hypothetical protein